MSEVTANYDQSWKEALNEYFESFLAFFFPVAHQAIDWTKTPESLDKELQEITASGETKKRITDKMYKVWLLDQTQVWILIHIEIQSQYDVNFEERMYIYNYRAFDLYHQFVVRGFTKEKVIKLFKIIDTMMTLPKQLQAGLVTKIKHFEEERKMPLISPTEQLAIERGIEQGIEQGRQREQQLIIRQINRRVGEMESSLIDSIRALTIEKLELLGEALLDFSSVTDLEQWLQNNPES
jgi:hypothetical protein